MGERRQIIYPDGQTVEYNYDENFRLSEIVDGNGSTAYYYDEHNRLIEKLYQNGASTLYNYDLSNRLQTLSHIEANQRNPLDTYKYEYDLLGNKVKIVKERLNFPEDTGIFEYTYDPLNRLQEVIKDGEALREYTYDGFGNRIKLVDNSGSTSHINLVDKSNTTNHINLVDNSNITNHTTSYIYNALNQLISTEDSKANKQEFRYDKRGNLIEAYEGDRLTNKYYYGASNRLEISFNQKTQQGATYQYNGLSHRVGRTEGEVVEPVLPTACLSEMSVNPAKKVEDVLDLTKKYHNLLQRTDNHEVTSFTWDYNLLSSNASDGNHEHYLLDELGSPIRVLDRLGDPQEVFGFDEFGNSLVDNNGEANANRPFTFTSYQQDEVANTYYAQAREYLPQAGRFVGEDIIKGLVLRPQTINSYLYCLNSPINLVDLDGKIPSIPPHGDIVDIDEWVDEYNREVDALRDSEFKREIGLLNVDPQVVFDNISYFNPPIFIGQAVIPMPSFLGRGAATTDNAIIFPRDSRWSDLLIHESSHFHGQYLVLGWDTYWQYVAIPSYVSASGPLNSAVLFMEGNDFVREMLNIFDGLPHYQMPWEVYVDIVGGVNMGNTEHDVVRISRALWYHEILQMKSPEHPAPLDQELIDLITLEFRGVNEDACP